MSLLCGSCCCCCCCSFDSSGWCSGCWCTCESTAAASAFSSGVFKCGGVCCCFAGSGGALSCVAARGVAAVGGVDVEERGAARRDILVSDFCVSCIGFVIGKGVDLEVSVNHRDFFLNEKVKRV